MNRGVSQLARLEIGYSLHAGASKGVREFVASPLLEQFQQNHPQVKLSQRVNSRGFPHVEASYCKKQKRNSGKESFRVRG